METRFLQCKECGAELDFATGLCPYCQPEEPAPAPAASEETLVLADDEDDPFVLSADMPIAAPLPAPEPPPPVVAPPPPAAPKPAPAPPAVAPAVAKAAPADAESDRLFGLVLFDAEEEIARGNAEKAMVLASRAVHERPDNLTARALYERARRELVKGRRREKLDARVREAERLARLGDRDEASRIVVSALKLVPDHELALKLYGRLREERLLHDSAEAEAERELDGLMRQQARQALDAARAALAAQRERQALQSIRRGLHLVPDDPDLLAQLAEVNARLAEQEAARLRHRALQAQTRSGLELLADGRYEDAERVLRAVVAEQPGHARAVAALERAMRRELTPPPVSATPETPTLEPIARPATAPAPPKVAPAPPRAEPADEPVWTEPALAEPVWTEPPKPPAPVVPPEAPRAAPAPVRASDVPRAAEPPPARSPAAPPAVRPLPPPELRVHRTAPTPLPYVLGAAALLAAVLGFLVFRSDDSPAPTTAAPTTTVAAVPATTPPPATVSAGPLAGLGAEARLAVERTLEQYTLALESRDPDRLELARPDLSPDARTALLASLGKAISVSSELEVLDVTVDGDGFNVAILRTLVLVGGEAGPPERTEETLRFGSVEGAWRLRPR